MDTFGEISGGELKLKGRCIDTILKEQLESERDERLYIGLQVTREGERIFLSRNSAYSYLDFAGPFSDDAKIQIMHMDYLKYDEEKKPQNLLIFMFVNKRQQIYERILMLDLDVEGGIRIMI